MKKRRVTRCLHDGYIIVQYLLRGKWVKQKEHTAIAELFILGRKLRKNEVVHHKNGVRSDNRLPNLQVMTRSEHWKLHTNEYWKKRKSLIQ